VIVMLGMDAPALTSSGADGDDLTTITPLVGDRDRRFELRQSLLETVLAAEEHLVVIRDGHDVRTNQEIPMAVPVAELRDAVLSMVHADHRQAVGEHIELHHPRQPFDEAYFLDRVESVTAAEVAASVPRSFDTAAAVAARARRRRAPRHDALLDGPLEATASERVELAELHRLLGNPIRFFLERRLELRMPRDVAAPGSTIPATLAHLDRWSLGEQLLDLRARDARHPGGGDLDDEAAILEELTGAWKVAAVRTGAVPPGRLGDAALDEVVQLVTAICRDAAAHGVLLGPVASTVPVEAHASDGTVVAGEVDLRLSEAAGERGPASVTCSRRRGAHRLAMWLDLAVLTLSDPATRWRGVVATRLGSGSNRKSQVSSYRLADGGSTDVARRVIDVVLDLHRRALREPLPLFRFVSEALWETPDEAIVWPDRFPDAAELLAYGHLSPAELCELPLLSHDPPGAAGDRARRYAEHLFGSMAATLEEVER
jgi:exodeoxyribonuclease V gamma subunit